MVKWTLGRVSRSITWWQRKISNKCTKMTTKSNSTNSSSTTADIHFSALCNAIEHEKLEKAKAILETHPSLQLDQPNNDGFTPLDLAFMTGNQDMLRLLMSHKCDGNIFI